MSPQMPSPRDWNREVVLPNGAFAKIIRPILAADIMRWFNVNPIIMHAGLISEIVEVDGKKLDFKELSAMEAVDFMPISNMVSKYIADIGMFKNGVA